MPLPLEKCEPEIFIPSSIKGLNEAYGSPLYNNDVLVSIHGKPAVGKTLFAYQEMMHAMSLGYNALYIDTEGGVREINKAWRETLMARFKPKKGGEYGKGYVEVRKNLESLLDFMGYKVEMKYKEAKIELRINDIYEGEFDKFVQKHDVKFVVLDSLSMPILSVINDEQQNRPARATAMSLITGSLLRVQEKAKCCALVIHHSSWNPTNPYEVFAKMWGGKRVHHASKRILYMDMREKEDLKNYRRIWISRIEDEASYGKVVGVKISGVGMEDYEDVDSLLTEAEKKRLGARE
ncbi:MAG: AAA family ATPase [Desulfurococcaceae archaeon]